jgi:hypothetical protein
MPSNYVDAISINQALYFDLFDDIEYKWLKTVLDPALDRDDESIFELYIEDLPCDRLGFCKTNFRFELQMVDKDKTNICLWGALHFKTKIFNKTIEYNGSSAFAMTLCGMVADNDSEEDEIEENLERALNTINIEALKKRQGLDEDDGFIKFLRDKQANKTEEDAVNVN